MQVIKNCDYQKCCPFPSLPLPNPASNEDVGLLHKVLLNELKI